MTVQRIDGKTIRNLRGDNILDNTITTEDIKDGDITDIDISPIANINTIKINWQSLTYDDAITKVIKSPEGLFMQSCELEDCINNTNLIANNAHINPIHLNYPLIANYINFIVTGNKFNGTFKCAFYNYSGNLLYESPLQSNSGTFKLFMPSLKLLPGVYYVLFVASTTEPKFLVPQAVNYAVIPNKGLYPISNMTFPTILNFSLINQTSDRQPWVLVSKY